MKKLIKWTLVLSLLGGVGWVAYTWLNQRSQVNAFAIVPVDAVFCLATPDPIGAWRTISDSKTWRHLQGNEYFAALTSSVNQADSLIRENELLFELIGSRPLVMSAHMVGLKQYEFLFVADLGKAAGLANFNNYISGFSASGYHVSREEYDGNQLFVVRDPQRNANIYLAMPGSLLAASYNRSILLKALNRANNDQVEVLKFSPIPGFSDGLLQVYVDYAQLPKFLAVYSNESRAYLEGISKSLNTTVLDFSFEDELLKSSGRTLLRDSVQSYIHSLAQSGKGRTDFISVAPTRTGFACALGFDSFRKFFDVFEHHLRQDVSGYDSWEASLQQIENYLNIDVRENLVDWIGDEVALLEIASPTDSPEMETAICIKARDIREARENLQYIEKMVRRKTPVKFRTVNYRGHSISYLSVKGMFKVLFGNLFSRYDKPYYTVLNDFVIFSNHPATLEGIIDDYLEGATLKRSDEFRDFRDEFRNESAVFIYANTDAVFPSLKQLGDKETQPSMEKNRDYIVAFRHIGFQLVPDGDGFVTTFAEQFHMPEVDPVAMALPTVGAAPVSAVSPDDDPMALPQIHLAHVNGSSYTVWYNDSTVYYRVGVRNGFKDGDYAEYYQDGSIKMKGHFRMGRREGVWRLFDMEGNLLLKRNYNNGEVTRERN